MTIFAIFVCLKTASSIPLEEELKGVTAGQKYLPVEGISGTVEELIHFYKTQGERMKRSASPDDWTYSSKGLCIGCNSWSGLCGTCCGVNPDNGVKKCLGCISGLCYVCCET